MSRNKTKAGELYVAERRLSFRQDRFVRLDDGSDDLNIDASFTINSNIWNSVADSPADWTRAGSAGQTETTASKYNGIEGLDTGVRSLDDETTFSTTAFNPETSNDAISFWVDSRAFPKGSNPTITWKLTSTQAGNKLNILDYIASLSSSKPYRRVIIPLSDFGDLSGNVDELVIKYEGKTGQHFFMDDFKLGSGPKIFRIDGVSTQARHVKKIQIVFSANDSGWSADSFINIANGLTAGFLIRHRQLSDSDVLWRINLKENTDIMGRLVLVSESVFPGTPDKRLLAVKLEIVGPKLIVNDDSVVDILVRDDLSGLTALEAFAEYELEDLS